MPESALVYTLNRVNWQIFGTLTFRKVNVPQSARLKMFYCVLYALAKWSGVSFGKLIWVLRQERGEIGDRLHLHFLLSRLPAEFINPKTFMAIRAYWKSVGGGISLVRAFDPSGCEVDYVLKECPDLVLAGANLYETSKFSNSCDSVLLSNSFLRSDLDRRSI